MLGWNFQRGIIMSNYYDSWDFREECRQDAAYDAYHDSLPRCPRCGAEMRPRRIFGDTVNSGEYVCPKCGSIIDDYDQ